ncbi:hypothetical protein HZH68_004255 [Vespula germanica]|uniref:Uncharacterized protein n=1 Tax=Vespula germanica TaxID=30212 RepID=A0A836UYI3_VESGE|nr:hypothetical protein HZH68_004255 [Vespula germanica]
MYRGGGGGGGDDGGGGGGGGSSDDAGKRRGGGNWRGGLSDGGAAGGWVPKFQGRLRRADLGIGQAEKQELRAKNEALARGYGKPYSIILTRDGGAKVVGRTWGVGVGTGESLKEEVLRELGIV